MKAKQLAHFYHFYRGWIVGQSGTEGSNVVPGLIEVRQILKLNDKEKLFTKETCFCEWVFSFYIQINYWKYNEM